MSFQWTERVSPVAKESLKFVRFLWRELQSAQIHVVAGYLAYVTLMSLVPLLVVMLSVLTAFPIFGEIKTEIEGLVYSNFLPTAGDTVQTYLTGFVANASKMSAVAVIFLFLLALMLISAIDKSLNRIWHVSAKRRMITSFSMYWMVLTLGPVMVGGSLAATSYVVSLVSLGDYDFLGISSVFIRALPLIISSVAFLILYLVVPNKTVPTRYAFAGAIVAAVLFEFAKKGFALYVTQFPSYQAIYGALAGIPILFVWVYLSWMVVLFGALVTASLESFATRHSAATEKPDTEVVAIKNENDLDVDAIEHEAANESNSKAGITS